MRKKVDHARVKAMIDLYRQMQDAGTEDEYQAALLEHDRITDQLGYPRFRPRSLAEFREGVPLTGIRCPGIRCQFIFSGNPASFPGIRCQFIFSWETSSSRMPSS